MSRLYEALQRADSERKVKAQRDLTLAVDLPRQPEPSALRAGACVDKQTVTKRRWRPVLDAIPCLLESGQVIEQFRGLRSRLVQFREEAPIKTLLISSGMPAEGKSFVTLNLAVNLARHNGSRVLLIDGDLRRPSLHNALGTTSTPGLSEFLSGTAELSEVMQCDEQHQAGEGRLDHPLSRLTFIPSGAPSNSSSDLLHNGRMATLIAALAPAFDWILIDSPPALAVSDSLELARNSDAVMLVAREGRTPLAVVQRAQAAFRSSRLLGFVLNGATEKNRSYYSSYYSDYTTTNMAQSSAMAIPQ